MLEPCQGPGDSDYPPYPSSREGRQASRQAWAQSQGHKIGGQGLAPRDGTCTGRPQGMGVSMRSPPPQEPQDGAAAGSRFRTTLSSRLPLGVGARLSAQSPFFPHGLAFPWGSLPAPQGPLPTVQAHEARAGAHVLNAGLGPSHGVCPPASQESYTVYSTHFIDEETEAQRGEAGDSVSIRTKTLAQAPHSPLLCPPHLTHAQSQHTWHAHALVV